MKTVNSVIFFIFIFLIISVVFNYLKNKDFFEPTNIGQSMDCYSDKIDKSILVLSYKLEYVNAFINFKKIPISKELEDSLSGLDIKLDKDTGVFDYIWSTIPSDSLCELVELDEVNSVFTFNKK